MLTFKVNDISKLLSLGVSAKTLLMFILYQIPLLLPMTLAISGFFAAYLVIQQLSEMSVFSSLRSSGLSLNTILSPLFFMGIVISILNFYLMMEVLPKSRIKSHQLFQDVSQMNPLVILKKGKVVVLQDALVHMNLDESHSSASDVFILFQNPYTKYLNLFKADGLSYKNDYAVEIKNSSLISTIHQEKGSLPTIVLENAESQSIPLSFFTSSLSGSKSYGDDLIRRTYDIMTMRELVLTYNMSKNDYLISEFIVRFGLGCLPFILIFIGSTISIGSMERKPQFNMFLLIFTFFLCITAVLSAKSLRQIPYISVPIIIIPFTISILIAIRYRSLLEKVKYLCK